MKILKFIITILLFLTFALPSYAETTVSAEVGFIFNTFLNIKSSIRIIKIIKKIY